MSILNCFVAIFLPLIFSVYLLYKRLNLSAVNKKILNLGTFITSLLGLVIFTIQQANYIKTKEIIDINYTIFNFDKITINFGILINQENLWFLIFASFAFTIIALYSKFYFDKKKQFIFTKQRFYIYLSFLIFNTYMFFVSPNLFQSFIFWTLEGIIIFIFSYFDIFKNITNYNTTRFQRISFVGDFSFLLGILILFKYAVLSEGYIDSSSLNYDELNILTSYSYGIMNPIEFKFCSLCFILAFMSRLLIFPFSCYYSFFANSSNIFYLTTISIANSLLGLFLFLKTISFFDLWSNLTLYIGLIFVFTIITSSIFLLFEKNIKIIFGYFYSILNSIILTCYLIFRIKYLIPIYFILNFIVLFILMLLFMKNKINLSSRIINKNQGFVLEKIHIIIFENLMQKVFNVINFIDEKIIQNVTVAFAIIVNYIATLFVLKTRNKRRYIYIKNIFIIFILFILFAIFVALFGRYR